MPIGCEHVLRRLTPPAPPGFNPNPPPLLPLAFPTLFMLANGCLSRDGSAPAFILFCICAKLSLILTVRLTELIKFSWFPRMPKAGVTLPNHCCPVLLGPPYPETPKLGPLGRALGSPSAPGIALGGREPGSDRLEPLVGGILPLVDPLGVALKGARFMLVYEIA